MTSRKAMQLDDSRHQAQSEPDTRRGCAILSETVKYRRSTASRSLFADTRTGIGHAPTTVSLSPRKRSQADLPAGPA